MPDEGRVAHKAGYKSARYLPITFDIPPAIHQSNSFILASILNTPDRPIYIQHLATPHTYHTRAQQHRSTACTQISTPAAATGALLCRQPTTTAVVEACYVRGRIPIGGLSKRRAKTSWVYTAVDQKRQNSRDKSRGRGRG